MNFKDTLSTQLPEPRDDDPETLRADILDELSDHLNCAYRRELMRGADPATAKRKALDQFGDPAAVARRLWSDAMRGKFMWQRILVGYSIVLTLFCLGLAVMMGLQAARAQREVAVAHAHAMEERRRAEEALAEAQRQLQAVTKPADAAKGSK
jgi:hypothetical protein